MAPQEAFLEARELAAERRSTQVEQIRRAAIANFVASSNQLAMLPPTALRVVEMANDPSATLLKIATVVRTDAGIASRILATANSAVYMGRYSSPITSLEKAVARVGLEGLKAIVLQLSLAGRVLRIKGLEREVQEMSVHAVYAACAARAIAKRLGLDAETGFLVGLLHDVGKLIGLETFMKASPTVRASFAPDIHGVAPLLTVTHEEIGGFAAQKWNLPTTVVEAIGHHHVVPDRLLPLQFPLLVHVADRIAHQASPDDEHPAEDLYKCPEVYKLGLDPGALDTILKSLPGDAAGLLSALG